MAIDFTAIEWQNDRALLGEIRFNLQHSIGKELELGVNSFTFYKIKALVDQYEKFFSTRPDFHPDGILELGLWDGGSTAFWFETLKPNIYVGLDNNNRGNSVYLNEYIARRGLYQRLKTYWNINQSDSKSLVEILESDLRERLNLVIDDASHLYEPTKRSFEIIFPRMSSGGLYIIEDWAWAHWAEYQAISHFWSHERPLTRLIFDLVESTGSWESGSSPKLIESISVYQGFSVIERGEKKIENVEAFKLDDHISRRPNRTISQRLLFAPKLARKHVRRLLDKHLLWRL